MGASVGQTVSVPPEASKMASETAPFVDEAGREDDGSVEHTPRREQILVPIKPLVLVSMLLVGVVLVWALLAGVNSSTMSVSERLQPMQKWIYCGWTPVQCHEYTTVAVATTTTAAP